MCVCVWQAITCVTVTPHTHTQVMCVSKCPQKATGEGPSAPLATAAATTGCWTSCVTTETGAWVRSIIFNVAYWHPGGIQRQWQYSRTGEDLWSFSGCASQRRVRSFDNQWCCRRFQIIATLVTLSLHHVLTVRIRLHQLFASITTFLSFYKSLTSF